LAEVLPLTPTIATRVRLEVLSALSETASSTTIHEVAFEAVPEPHVFAAGFVAIAALRTVSWHRRRRASRAA
jgi:hypothetical protein